MSNPIQNFVVVSPTAVPAAGPQPNDVWERIATALETIAAAISQPEPQPVYEPDFADAAPDPFAPVDDIPRLPWEEPAPELEYTDEPPNPFLDTPWELASSPVVTVGEREVTFPNVRTANVVRNLLADDAHLTSIYMAADAAGYYLPPLGQDIGAMVPPTDLQPGDVVFSDFGGGIYLGEGEVLMEDHSVRALSDVAVFNHDHQGLFRLEDPDLIPNV